MTISSDVHCDHAIKRSETFLFNFYEISGVSNFTNELVIVEMQPHGCDKVMQNLMKRAMVSHLNHDGHLTDILLIS